MVFWYAWVAKKHEYVKKNADEENDKKITKRTTKDIMQGTLTDLMTDDGRLVEWSGNWTLYAAVAGSNPAKCR
ncbi:unnamed protein product [Euphydryas editha]|uniref:Uncharacterized protein n=1 Tax=Euphydryas editha TaxID=104508 RepID=A0AAU9TXU0_EUPED|nr:unnamed protein product [Euphydryas editha]